MTSAHRPAAEPTVPAEDVDDVIGAAEAIKRSEEDQLSLAELMAVGRELDLDERHVERAVEKLATDRKEQQARQLLLAARRRKLLAWVGGALLALVLLVSVVTLAARSTLTGSLAAVEQKRAQVHSVVERQARVKALYAGRAATSESDAELLGAENRVRIEQRRYDEAAARYNADAKGLGAGLARALFGLPEAVPMSNEVAQW